MATVMDRSKVVVVLEDDQEVRGLLASVLQDQGYYVVPVERGERALEVLQQVRATLLIMDLMLPEMDGKEVLQKLRADERTRDVPVLVLSAHAHLLGDKPTSKRNRVVDKPFEIDKVLAEVQKIIGKPGDEKALLSEFFTSSHFNNWSDSQITLEE